MHTLVLLRHGQSAWNLENRFTGWTDVDLSPEGEQEARDAARLLADEGLTFDVCHTSVLTRAIRTLYIVQHEMGLSWLPVHKHWRLNERHYGGLQGLDKAETAARFGEEQVFEWRRSYDTPPPPLPADDPRSPAGDARYAGLAPDVLPASESLKETVARVLPYWHDVIAPQVLAGQRVLVAAHGNSLRALVMHLDGMTPEAVTRLNIPTGLPLVYTLDGTLRPLGHRYLGDPAVAEAKAKAVAAQGAARK
ncbi:2,3-diphosphoglycerate-dependent phosphoglycerate mutase [Nitratidesulfovibrio sp. SRB-5]|uniref:2,3-diphosphoglycerate-dependent phosphoglycerate mutase n=1 Tax=Nitratidesulfovibrio sp. SRB-5 TaxID=2872636 RepID=UPI0010278E12|nr:2,3-diphosphoglycerate-dependent phosphoglycerate mutase [Nitratidesulfovibrio sp. SRB-5]MBZ2172382.1 2,3-diphosphoglycerate-dependent phosphoglycerate mutase [Nitratidesulfovibrio sp. SRB-5]RXF76996.1 2,3-diphosphoglycerate-dependent phosphoglycerate mutase [Desulfovibrio sp. DS-1]